MTLSCYPYARRCGPRRPDAVTFLPLAALLLLITCPRGAVGAWPGPVREIAAPPAVPSSIGSAGRPNGAALEPYGRSYERELREAMMLEEQGQFALAWAAYRRLVTDFPFRYEAYHRLGVLDDYQGRHQSAQMWYTHAYRLCSDDPWLLNDLGRCLLDQQKWTLAATVLERAVALAPHDPRHQQDLAVARAMAAGGGAAAGWYNVPGWGHRAVGAPGAPPPLEGPPRAPRIGQAYPSPYYAPWRPGPGADQRTDSSQRHAWSPGHPWSAD